MYSELKTLLIGMRDRRASDLHISAGNPIYYRIDGQLVTAGSNECLSAQQAKDIIYSLLTKEQIIMLDEEKELDFSFQIEDVARYRGNIFFQRGNAACAVRLIPLRIMSLEECGLPANIVKDFCRAQKGLVLVTGTTGSGKSTTLAAMVDEINNTRSCHIVTVEDPIEFVHTDKKALIAQRQISYDTYSFSNALKHVLRQDPDVILIGELRDLDTIQQALVIADTGHLVLGTLHTSDSVQSINRIIDVFPPHQQHQVRSQLSFVLLGIVSQQLLPKKESIGRVLAAEILVATPPVRSMIRDAKEHQILSVIQTSQKAGMKTMNQALADLYFAGKITHSDAIAKTSDPEDLAKVIGAK
ncbi:MAG: type IV pilus twitching motility protein PilT [Candidatus Omnitrophota bacterium]